MSHFLKYMLETEHVHSHHQLPGLCLCPCLQPYQIHQLSFTQTTFSEKCTSGCVCLCVCVCVCLCMCLQKEAEAVKQSSKQSLVFKALKAPVRNFSLTLCQSSVKASLYFWIKADHQVLKQQHRNNTETTQIPCCFIPDTRCSHRERKHAVKARNVRFCPFEENYIHIVVIVLRTIYEIPSGIFSEICSRSLRTSKEKGGGYLAGWSCYWQATNVGALFIHPSFPMWSTNPSYSLSLTSWRALWREQMYSAARSFSTTLLGCKHESVVSWARPLNERREGYFFQTSTNFKNFKQHVDT